MRRAPAPIRDLPRAEILVRRRRVVSACLWIAAPAIWLTRYALSEAHGAVLTPIELAVYLIAAAMFMVSAVGLTLRPELARGLGLAALLGSLGALAFKAPNAS